MSKSLKLKFARLNQEARMPRKSESTAMGADVWTSETETVVIYPCSKYTFKTGLAPIIPNGYGLQVADRSSFGSNGIVYGAGAIDQEYHGEIRIVLINTNSNLLTVISSQDKKFVEKCNWFDIKTKQFIEGEPEQELVDEFKIIPKELIIVKYLEDAIAQLKLEKVPTVEIIEVSKKEIEEAMKKSVRKANGFGSTDSKGGK